VDPDVLVVEVDVDVAVEVAAVGEQLRRRLGMLLGDRAQDRADVLAAGVDLALAVRRRAQDRGNANSGHEGQRGYPAAAQNAS
jgi:hypothetical protein